MLIASHIYFSLDFCPMRTLLIQMFACNSPWGSSPFILYMVFHLSTQLLGICYVHNKPCLSLQPKTPGGGGGVLDASYIAPSRLTFGYFSLLRHFAAVYAALSIASVFHGLSGMCRTPCSNIPFHCPTVMP